VIEVQRALALALAAATLMLWFVTDGARAAVNVQNVNTAGYPSVTFSVVTGSPTSVQPRVWENGLLIGDVQSANLGRTASVAVAIDISRSMAGRSISDAASAADTFVTTKPRGDAIELVAFGSRALTLTGFSTSTIDADGALRAISVDRRSGTALYDAVVLSANALATRPGGRVLIVLTDGKDVSSRATLDEAVAAAQRAGVAVYPIAIAGPEYTPGPLQRLAAATGGSFYRASTSGALTGVYGAIGSQLARTWQISYLTAARPGDGLKLRVTVPGQGAAARDVQVPAGPGGAAAPPGPSRLLPERFYRSPFGTMSIAVAVGFCVLLMCALVLAARRSLWLKERVEPHVTPGKAKRARKGDRERLKFTTAVVRATERAFGNLRQFRSLARVLDRADLPLRAAEFAYIILGSGVAVGLVAAIALQSVLGLFIGGLIGGAAPLGIVAMKARKRLKAFDNQLPDLLVTLAASLKAGHSFRQGIQSVVDEGMEPAAREFKRVLTDTQLGRPMEDALGEMAERVGSKNFSFVITAVTIQRQVGGSLASLFDMVAETVRQRQQFARRIRSLTAMGRLSAYVLVGLPFFLALAMTLINRSFMAPLWTRHAGHLLIILALTMMVIGSSILKKIVSFRG
jgi:tight adherence protein B